MSERNGNGLANGTGFDHSKLDELIDGERLPARRSNDSPGAVHVPCVECVFGTWWESPLPQGAHFRCDCGVRMVVVSSPADVVVHVEEEDAGPLVIDKSPAPARPMAPGVEELIERGVRAREWCDEAMKRLHTLMRRLVRTGGSESDAASVLDCEAQRWRAKAERRKTRERSSAAAKP